VLDIYTVKQGGHGVATANADGVRKADGSIYSFLTDKGRKSYKMKKKPGEKGLAEWATQITALRERLEINQAELARRMDCSPMTVSRWERGLLQPSAEYFIQLGNLGNKTEAWFFWEEAGIRPSKMISALGSAKRQFGTPHLGSARDEGSKNAARDSDLIGLPLLKAVVGSHGVDGDRRSSLRAVAASRVIGAPASWCPNPGYTTLLRVKGHSMEPLIRQGDLIAVDSFQSEAGELYGKLVVASSEKHGLCVSWLRQLENLTLLEAEDRGYPPAIFSKAGGWRIVGRVLWWISMAP
jgi:transcriptional regulator with XRE-family HTH domain